MRLIFTLFCAAFAVVAYGQYNQCGPTLTGGDGAGGQFGQYLAMSDDGQTVAVGAVLEGANNTGAVRIFRWEGDEYRLLSDPITTTESNALFGRSIALNADGSRLAFGTSLRLNTAGNSQIGFTVYVYDITDNDYQHTATISGAPNTGLFGTALDMSNDGMRLVIGDPDGGVSGRVHIYDLDDGTNQWVESQQIEQTVNSNDFGNAVAISGDGNRIIVGAESTSDDNVTDNVYQYERNPTSGQFVLERTYEPQFGSLSFGIAVDADDDGDTFVIADDRADVGLGSDVFGYVAIYGWNPDGSARFFTTVVSPTTSGFSNYGTSAAISGDGGTLVVGDNNFTGQALSGGRAAIYQIADNGIATLDETEILGERLFFTGRAVDVSTDGREIIVGSSLANANDGLARVYSPACEPVSTREAALDLPGLRVYSDGVRLNVDFGRQLAGSATSTLVSSDGRVLAQRVDADSWGYAWPVDVPRGVYFLQVQGEGGMLTRKFVW